MYLCFMTPVQSTGLHMICESGNKSAPDLSAHQLEKTDSHTVSMGSCSLLPPFRVCVCVHVGVIWSTSDTWLYFFTSAFWFSTAESTLCKMKLQKKNKNTLEAALLSKDPPRADVHIQPVVQWSHHLINGRCHGQLKSPSVRMWRRPKQR